jgi:flagellum-specific peptidoglycan hydrolase FlgJ
MLVKFKNLWINLRSWVKIAFVVIAGAASYVFLGSNDVSEPIAITNNSTNIVPDSTNTDTVDMIMVGSTPPARPKSLETNAMVFDGENKLFALNESDLIPEKAKMFIERFINTAIIEKFKYGIPISITLAQGIIESNHGSSRLAKNHNNFFGLKCKIKCKDCDGKGTKMTDECVNFNDDAKDDYFRRFASAWESFRARSILLSSKPRYESLFKLSPNDYSGWCYGLKKCGYATDKNYAKTLLNVIKRLHLNKFDDMDIWELAKERGIVDKMIKE